MKVYLNLLDAIINGPRSDWKGNRTGVRAKSMSGYMIEHNMADGFPLLTTKYVAFKQIAIENQFFIQGMTDKKWLQEQGCHIWDPWCSPLKVPYGTDEETKAKMAVETDLGPVYGSQWRDFGGTGYDQLKVVVDRLHNNPSDRRMIVSAWNPPDLDKQALPPCHLLFQVVVTGENFDTLNLNWYQRSCDTPLGIPYNIAGYALILKLLALEAGMKEGWLCGMLGDVHIYEDQIDIAKEQIKRIPGKLPQVEIPDFTNIFDWTYHQRKVVDYKHQGKIEYPIAV